MIIFFEIPFVLILLLFLGGASILMMLFGNIAYILFIVAQIAIIIIGIIVLVKTLPCIFKENKYFTLVPIVLFVGFCVAGLFLFYTFFCLSENYTTTYSSGFGTLTGQRHVVQIYSLLLSLAIVVVFMKVISYAFDTSLKRSLIVCLICVALLIIPLAITGYSCYRQYYLHHSSSNIGTSRVSEEIDTVWIDVNYSEYRFPYFNASHDSYPIPIKIESGTTVYLTGKTSIFNGENCVEVYLADRIVCGYIPESTLEE